MATKSMTTRRGGSIGQEPVLEYGQPLDEDDLLAYIDHAKQEAHSYWDPIHERDAELYRLYGGDYLTATEQKYLEDEQPLQPVISANVALGTVNAILGQEDAARLEARFLGLASQTQDLVGDWLTRINRALSTRGAAYERADWQEGECLLDLVIAGMGFCETYLDLSRSPHRVTTRHVEPWEMFFDPDALEANFADASFAFRERYWTVESAQAMWPEKADELRAALRADTLPVHRDLPSTIRSRPSGGRFATVPILDFAYCRFVPMARWIDPEQGEKKTPKKELQERQTELASRFEQELALFERAQLQHQLGVAQGAVIPPAAPMQPPQPLEIEVLAEYPGKCWYRAHAIMASDKGKSSILLDHRKLPVASCPFQAATGMQIKTFEKRRKRYMGVMALVRDVQIYFNKALSTFLEILARGAKGGAYLDRNLLPDGTDENEFIRRQSLPGQHQLVDTHDRDIRSMVMERGSQPTPTGIESLFELLREMPAALTGVTDWLKGTATTERSNVLIANLQQQSVQMLRPLLKGMEAMMLFSARLRVEMALLLLEPDQVNEMIGDIDPAVGEGLLWQSVQGPDGQMTRQEIGTPYDVLTSLDLQEVNITVEVGEASQTAKQAVWMVLEQGVMKALFETMQGAGVSLRPLLKALITNLPLPGSQAAMVAAETGELMDLQEQMETVNGIVEATLAKGPDGAAEIVNAIMGAIQSMGQQQPGAEPQVQ